MKWEEQESCEDETEFWIVGESYYDKKLKSDVWTFMADVFIDKKKDFSEVEFEVFSFPRHIVEDSGWKTLKDAIEDLNKSIKEMKRIDKVAKKLKLKVFSDEFIGFKTSFRLNTTNKKEIENKILEVREKFGL